MTHPTNSDIVGLVEQLRNDVIVGDCIDMLPYRAEHDADVVDLRSLPDVRYSMNIDEPPSLPAQAAWRTSYRDRRDDITWLLRDKRGTICGTNRLYNINSATAEKGSQIVHPDIAPAVPAALESDVRIIEAAFTLFNVHRVVTHIREDNSHVKSMNLRFGFVPKAELNIRGVKYLRFELTHDAWDPEPFLTILQHWARRYASPA